MTRVTIHLVPNASKTEVVGQEGHAWKVRLAAAPIEGKANIALIKFLAEVFDVAPTTMDMLKGQGSKIKVVEVPITEEDVYQAMMRQIR